MVDSPVLELTIISGESLFLTGKQPIRKSLFSVAIKTDLSGDAVQAAAEINNAGCGSSGFHQRSQKLFVTMPLNARFFTLEVYSGDKFVGSTNIPASDFTGVYFPVDYLHFLSYRLRDRRGMRNGIINFSVRAKSSLGSTNAGCAAAATSCPPQWIGGPASQSGSSGVVVGVPVWHS